MCNLGGGGTAVKPLTQEELLEDTDNPFENPGSGTEVPSWKLKADSKVKTKKNKSKLTTSDTYQG